MAAFDSRPFFNIFQPNEPNLHPLHTLFHLLRHGRFGSSMTQGHCLSKPLVKGRVSLRDPGTQDPTFPEDPLEIESKDVQRIVLNHTRLGFLRQVEQHSGEYDLFYIVIIFALM